tara:strand:+ start:903 stop:1121 length:219 start_codon:yes stop_codon:yes gene_type:complete
MDHPHHLSQSMSDWDIEHQECVGHALDEGIDNFSAMLSFAADNMTRVSEPRLKQLWEEAAHNWLPPDEGGEG